LIDLNLEKYSYQLDLIKQLLQDKNVLVAISGGVDSTLVLLLALKYTSKAIPVFFNAPIFSKNDIDDERRLCSSLGIQLELVEFNPLNNKEF